MNRPPARELIRLALALGAGVGALEVGLRTSPRLGLSPAEAVAWLATGVGLSVAVLVPVALLAWVAGRRAHGMVPGALLLLHAAVAWRVDLHVNAFTSEPRVWGGLLAIGLGSALAALVLAPWVRRWRHVCEGIGLLGLVVGVGLVALRAVPPAGPPRGDRPSVLLVTLDTTRADRLGAYGAPSPTPAFDRLAREGLLFEDAVATAPLTEPSHLAILGGNPPHRSGVVANGTGIGDRPELLSRALGSRGWTTAAFVGGFPLHSRFGWSQGFDVYDDDFGDLVGLHRLNLVKAADQVLLRAHALRERRADRVVGRALGWLDRHGDDAFFLWVHLFDAHGPYEAPGHAFDPPVAGELLDLAGYWPPRHRAVTSTDWLVAAYDAEVRFADAQMGRLLEALDARGALDSTLVVVVADHGESLTEHGYLFDHGDDLFDPSLRVPWVVRWPGKVPPGARLGCQASTADVTPTVLGLLGVSDGADRQGRDRSAELRGSPCTAVPVVATTVAGRFVDAPPVDHALREDAKKVVRHGDPARGVECFDLAEDPGEERALAACPPGIVEGLERELGGGRELLAPVLEGEVEEALRGLGYVE